MAVLRRRTEGVKVGFEVALDVILVECRRRGGSLVKEAIVKERKGMTETAALIRMLSEIRIVSMLLEVSKQCL